MEPITLREVSLLKATENLNTLIDLLDFCNQNTVFLNSCENSENFWKRSLIRIMGNIIVLQRGDLNGGSDWYNFIKLLSIGIVFKYSLRHNATQDIWDITPEPHYNHLNDEDEYVHGDEIHRYSFEIPAVLPNVGVQGYFVRLLMDECRHVDEENVFFVHDDINIALQNAAKFIGESYHLYTSRRIGTGWNPGMNVKPNDIKYDFTDQYHRISELWEQEDFKQLPEAPFFVNLVMNDFIKFGEQSHAWIVLYLRNALEMTNESNFVDIRIMHESSWIIKPITF